jgi:hypothetical protein
VWGRLIGWYLTFGRHDWLVIGEFPDEKAAASAILTAAGGGSLSEIETTVAMTAKDAHATFESAGKAASAERFRQSFDKTSVRADIPADIHKALWENSCS